MISAIKGILKDSVIYGIANIIQKLTPLIIIPIITAHFDKTAFKVYDLSFIYTYLVTSLVILGLDSAASVFFFERQKEYADKKKILFYSLFLQLFVALLYLIIFYPFRFSIAGFLFSNDPVTQKYWLLALFLIPGHILLNFGLNVLLWLHRKRQYLFVCFLQTIFSVGGVYATVVLGNGSIDSVFYVLIGVTTICGLIAALMIRAQIFRNPFPLDFSLAGKLLLFGLPFGITAFLRQLIPSIDRFFLMRYHFVNELPEYLLAAKIGGFFNMASTAFALAFTPYSLNKLNQEDAENEISELFRIIYILAFTTVPVILVFKSSLIQFFADASYASASRLFPFFFFGWVFDLFTHFSMLGVYKSKKSFLVLVFLVAGTALISFLNIILIPQMGVTGSALSFGLTKLGVFLITFTYLRRYFRLKVRIDSFLLLMLTAGIICYISYQVSLLVYLLIVIVFGWSIYVYIRRTFLTDDLRAFFLRKV